MEQKCSQCANPKVPGRRLCREHLDYYQQAAKKWRDKQRAAGLCVVCGKNPLVTKNYCEVCRQRANARAKRTRIIVCSLCAVSGHHRREHKKLGLCWHCNRKAKGGLCKYHLEDAQERYREKSRKVRAARQDAKVCRRCGKPSFGKTLCPEHLRYMAAWQKRHRLRQSRQSSGSLSSRTRSK